ncbi:MAG: glycosyltransferase [Candidatus Omnitrophica bacterium]|nr:glycosyltransferase [Candidatus Omnitrophota bacterium]
MKIALIYNKDNNSTTGIYIEKVFQENRINYSHFWTKDADNIPKQFDLYLRIDHGDYKYDLPEDLRPAVFYVIDTHLKKPYKKIRRQARHYDVVFCSEKTGLLSLRRQVRNVDFQRLPLSCDPQIHKKLNLPKKYDIGFVGSQARKFPRGRLIDVLREKYPNSYIKGAKFKQMSEIYSSSKIGFNYAIANGVNMRNFEIMSCGCFLLTNRIKDNGFYELFEEGKHLVTYSNEKELLRLIEYYLHNDSERERIAQAGFELVTERHTYYHRVQTLFNYLAFKWGGKFNQLRI